MRAMPATFPVLAIGRSRREPEGAPVDGIAWRHHARGIARMARFYEAAAQGLWRHSTCRRQWRARKSPDRYPFCAQRIEQETHDPVADGIEAALAQATAVPGAGDIAVAGGASTVNQSLAAGLLDELRLHIAPFTLGAGTRVFEGVPPLKLEQVSSRTASIVTHVTYRIVR
ncbi:dihydrofolate reductase family protein [Luteimonas suaedae]|uniref:dihydrofolate reductase family protein n=1 Tax=Luteimonas suaedae TaxID=2605430 RepID=UPI0011EF151A|nr:dihydrofolate reductase family protein [Luteimonas suaedae]